MTEPDNPLWHLAARLADWLDREGFSGHDKAGLWPWTGDALWRDGGTLPSGDSFTLWVVYDVTAWPCFPGGSWQE